MDDLIDFDDILPEVDEILQRVSLYRHMIREKPTSPFARRGAAARG